MNVNAFFISSRGVQRLIGMILCPLGIIWMVIAYRLRPGSEWHLYAAAYVEMMAILFIAHSPANLWFRHVLRSHRAWLESDGSLGKKAQLCRVNLFGMDLSGVDLRYADISCANLMASTLRDAKFQGANLSKSHCGAVDAEGASFEEANLDFVNFSGATLNACNFMRTSCKGTRFAFVSIQLANMTEASLVDAEFKDSDMTNVIGLTHEQIVSAKPDNKTKLPKLTASQHECGES